MINPALKDRQCTCNMKNSIKRLLMHNWLLSVYPLPLKLQLIIGHMTTMSTQDQLTFHSFIECLTTLKYFSLLHCKQLLVLECCLHPERQLELGVELIVIIITIIANECDQRAIEINKTL